MLIFIVGYMASGKTSLGLRLAQYYKYEFVDVDAVIEKKENKTISEIFSLGGEDLFRTKERDALKSLANKKNTIVSTGGGAAIYKNNMELMNQYGTSIFLDVSVNEICSRLYVSGNKRPLIEGLNEIELNEFVNKNLSYRLSFYRKANYSICSDNISVEDMVKVLGE